jgi:tRNA(Ile)-lysidine synthase
MVDGVAVSAAPVTDAEFDALMAGLAPFEPGPRIAVAVSGGSDSLALTLLADRWARSRGGALVALTVDHRLRTRSAAEAAQLGAWLAAQGIAHRILVWEGPRPRRSLQEAARRARYRLLEEWCARNGMLHLLLAHHRQDQAETLLLRLVRGSGLDGLAGMGRIVERASCRILRPLLEIPPERLKATLEAEGRPWIEDPSNRDPGFARARLRQSLPLLAAEGLTAERLAATAERLGRARAALEAAVAALLARAAAVHPAGFARLDSACLAEAPTEIGLRALAAILTMIGGSDYPPRLARLERLYHTLQGGSLGGGRTLGGCRVVARRGSVVVCREPAAMAPPVPAPPGALVAWDGRFRLALAAGAPAGLRLGALGSAPVESAAAEPLPALVRAGLPALLEEQGEVVAVPLLAYAKSGYNGAWIARSRIFFRPTRPLTGSGFTVV